MIEVSENINEFDHFTNLFNGMFIGKLSKSVKLEKKNNPKKKFFFEVIRNQFSFGSNIDNSFIKNKQKFNSELRTKINSFSPEDGLKYIHSKGLINELNKQTSDVIIDCSGVIGTPDGLNSWSINVCYNFHYNTKYIDYVNFDLSEMVKSTPIEYSEEFFLVGVNNSDKFISSIIAAYLKVFPDVFPELFKTHSYDAVLALLPMALNVFSYKNHYIESDEVMIQYVNAFFDNYVQFDDKIESYVQKYYRPQ